MTLITPELPAAELLSRAGAALAQVRAGRVALQLRARHLDERERRIEVRPRHDEVHELVGDLLLSESQENAEHVFRVTERPVGYARDAFEYAAVDGGFFKPRKPFEPRHDVFHGNAPEVEPLAP